MRWCTRPCSRSRGCACALVLLVLVAVLAGVGRQTGGHMGLLMQRCSQQESLSYLKTLCEDYRSGKVSGSLCEPLCVRQEIVFLQCLGHGVKMHVLLAQWGHSKVVLKTPKPLGDKLALLHLENMESHADKQQGLTRAEFIKQANVSVFLNIAGHRNAPSTISALDAVFTECDVLGDGLLSRSEALICWQLVETNEYMLYSMLAGNSAIPDLYGVCGHMYAVQYATSQPFENSQSLRPGLRPWAEQARLAISLLKLAQNVEDTPYGTFFLCDVQESNFGVLKEPQSGRLVAKAVDVDISWFEADLLSAARFEKNKSCSSDEDCAFVSCQVPCSSDTNTCSGRIGSSNMQVLCKRLLLPRARWVPGLLWSPPASVAAELQHLLDLCAFPSNPQPHFNPHLLQQLINTLQNSITLSDR